MKLFVAREAPAGWTPAYSAQQAIAVLQSGVVDEIYVEQELGHGAGIGTGSEVLRWVENQVISDPQFKLPKIKVVQSDERLSAIAERIKAARK